MLKTEHTSSGLLWGIPQEGHQKKKNQCELFKKNRLRKKSTLFLHGEPLLKNGSMIEKPVKSVSGKRIDHCFRGRSAGRSLKRKKKESVSGKETKWTIP
jgi:hypothetical protein